MVTMLMERPTTRAEKHRLETAKYLAAQILKEEKYPAHYARIELERQGVHPETQRMVLAMVEGGVV